MTHPLIIFCGLSGSGKTFNAQYLLKQLPEYVYLNPEVARGELHITSYSRKDTPKVLAKMVDDIETYAREKKGVIVDANLKTNDTRQIFYDVASFLKSEAVIVEMVSSEEDAKQRITTRDDREGTNHPKDPAIYDSQKKFWQDIQLDFMGGENAHVAWVRFDTSTRKATVMRNTPFSKKIAKLLEIKE